MLATRRFATLLLVFALFAAGCVSTQKRYEKAAKLEAEGRYAEAADLYIRVLEKASDFGDARARLRDAGARALDNYFAEARVEEAAGDVVAAGDAVQRLDNLRRRAAGVGVELLPPEGYAAFRDDVMGRAVGSYVARAEAAERQGDWEEARRLYARAIERFDLPADQRAPLEAQQGRVLLRWAEAEHAAARHRSAYDKTQQALDLLGPEAPLSERALDLQEDALAAGTRRVAILPFSQTEAAAREVSRELLPYLSDVLLYEHAAEPPLFIEVIEAAEVRQALRRYRYGAVRLTDREAADVGRRLGADFVVVSELAEVAWEERDVREETRRVRTKGRAGKDTTFVVQRLTLAVEAEMTYTILNADGGGWPRTRTVEADARGPLARGRYPGNPNTLDLRRQDLALFDEEELAAAEREIEDDLAERLAERLAAALYRDLLDRIP